MKERLDKVLLKKGLARSREAAQAMIEEGRIAIRGIISLKPSTMVDINADIETIDINNMKELRYVSRGGLKLEGALEGFNITVIGKTALDVGASTGGFTDCLLQRGIERVYCIDVGYGQLAWKVRSDSRVIAIDRVNARYLSHEIIPELADLAVIDVSFISLTKIIPSIIGFLKTRGEILSLVKPQFEVGRRDVGKGGIVRDEEKRLKAVDSICDFYRSLGLHVEGAMQSPICGQKGNIEYFIYALTI